MANNHVQSRWGEAPSFEELQRTIDQHSLSTPRPTIKVNMAVKDIPHSAIEAVMAMLGEHGVDYGVTLTAVYDEGQQLTFWENRVREREPEPV